MALYKIGSQLKIIASASAVEDLIIDKPLQEKQTVIETKRPDFIYFRARAISAGDQGPKNKEGCMEPNPNGNGDYFPRKELEASYSSFVGRNLFLNHDSDHPIKSVGKVIDASLVEDPETGEFYVECLSKIDRKLHPEIARKVETGELDKVSMGCSCEQSMCSICGTTLHSDADEKCDHLTPTGLLKPYLAEIDIPEYGIRRGDRVKAFAINTGITFNELSIVNVPADSRAVIKTVISNLKDRLSKKASLSKEEQLDLVGQMDKLFAQLDEKTKDEVKAEFCGCPVKEASPMVEKSTSEDYKQVLAKISALEMAQLESYIEHRTKKATVEAAKPVIEEAAKKEESLLQRIMDRAKDTFAGKLFSKQVQKLAEEELSPKKDSITAKFSENKDLMASTWTLNQGDKVLLEASLNEIWGAEFAKLPFEDQKWATSNDYGQALVARYEAEGLAKLADALDVSHKLSKEANEGDVKKPAGSFAKPSTGTSNKEHTVKTDYSEPKAPGSPATPKAAPKGEEVKTEYTLGKPEGEHAKPKAAPKPEEVKTEYDVKKPEGTFVKPGAPNPEEKKHDKSTEKIKTGYEAGDHLKEEASKTEDTVKVEATTEKKADSWHKETGPDERVKAPDSSVQDKMPAPAKADKDADESAKESTLPKGTPDLTKAPETSKEEKEPAPASVTTDPDTSVKDTKFEKHPNMTSKPEVSSQEDQYPAGGTAKEPDSSVKESSKKTADTSVQEPTPEAPKTMGDAPESAVKPDAKPADPMAPAKEAVGSAFDKLDGDIDVGEGYKAHKDPESKEIIISKDGKEVKRLPDGFGDQVPTVMKLLRSLLGLPPMDQPKDQMAPKPEEKPEMKPENPAEEIPTDEKTDQPDKSLPTMALSSQNPELAAKEAALKAKEEELQKKEAELKAIADAENGKRFASALNARSEKCQVLVRAMIEKEALSYDNEAYEAELKSGLPVLDARRKAFEAAIDAKMKELMALDDTALVAVAKTIEGLKRPVSGNPKKASRLPSMEFHADLSGDQEIETIFKMMGNGKKLDK